MIGVHIFASFATSPSVLPTETAPFGKNNDNSFYLEYLAHLFLAIAATHVPVN